MHGNMNVNSCTYFDGDVLNFHTLNLRIWLKGFVIPVTK